MSKQLALVIDLNVCVGCHACVTSCKEWNNSGSAGPLADQDPYDADPTGTFFNRVQTYEAGVFPGTETIHFPKSCLHCEEPPCVPVCPTGASYKRAPVGQAFTQAGLRSSLASRSSWIRSTHRVHLVITWRASSISRAPYGQAQAQYLQPMHLS